MENENSALAFLFVSAVVAIAVVIRLLFAFFLRFNRNTRFISKQMDGAKTDEDYLYWRRELRCHYLCLIPFVNDKNASALYDRLFYKPKHAAKVQRADGIWHILAPSLCGAVLCSVCLCGMSFAWFTSTRTVGGTSVQAAEYKVTVSLTESDGGETENFSADLHRIYSNSSLPAGTYTVTVTSVGTAKNGYCKIVADGDVYYTPQIGAETPFTFTIVAKSSVSLEMIPEWGTCTAVSEELNGENPKIECGQTVNPPLQSAPQSPSASTGSPNASGWTTDTSSDPSSASSSHTTDNATTDSSDGASDSGSLAVSSADTTDGE